MTTRPPNCPYAHSHRHRKSGRGEDGGRAIEHRGDTWHLRSYAAVKQVLRDGDRVRQGIDAALGAKAALQTRQRKPVIFQDGAPHREQRAAIARFFTPSAVAAYGALIEAASERILAGLRRSGRGDLSAMSMQLAVEVAAQVVGLTNARRPGTDRRIAALMSQAHPRTRLGRRLAALHSQLNALRFYLLDVRPAIAARRKKPREDVISHLLAQGYRDVDILTECMTYAFAGMVTTREFVGMAAWHLLEDQALRRDYLAAQEPERHRILHEILRLEPVASHLYRRTVAEVRLRHGGETYTVPAGALLVLDLRAANADPEAVGAEPLALCPQRPLARGVHPFALSFGDGAHRCPGAYLAIKESDLFLQQLLRLPVILQRPPRLTWSDQLGSYELRDVTLELASAGGSGGTT
ncbi:cytochrome P450 [Truepera radiovictrix]|uniref:Cytochrome P450 n=1 Tax=Truepera radiovictrix (strain DSM 17093 / CIP 108686 / LMG 22925 / RQ-24) TaxID=649638 RepID=D7CRS2_TRURR|nr:cytochrome P450 [Truepera radiovictrix]ADI15250.1 cytochrome P450 [Truepera radiovictrix DSM 17093]WMT56198.1 cytochrome P450 [Truepera radiovictrix]